MFAADAARCMRRSTGGSGGGGAGAHKYWRVNITQNAGDTTIYCNIGEIKLREVSGGQTTTVGGIAIASSQYDSTYSAAKAFDGAVGSPANSWLSTNGVGLPQWIGYQHAAEVEIVEVAITAGYSATRAPISFTIDYSENGADWITAKTVTNEPPWSIWQERIYTI